MTGRTILPHNLPHLTTSFIGRQAEISDIGRLLDTPTCQLLTLVGPGGIGKTRLAIEVAREQQKKFSDGVWFVPLAPLSLSDQIPTTIIKALEIQIGGQPSLEAEILNFLKDKQLLLVLDNFEHLASDTSLIESILTAAPSMKILVTSRITLNMQAEWVQAVKGMHYPNDTSSGWDEFSAIKLFAERAQRVRPDFSLNQSAKCVVRICQLVEGMPLALELAAAWIKTIPCDAVAQHIQRGLDFLASNQRDLPQRQRSMRAVFDHSWNLLTPEEQRVFPRFSVFHGGCTLEAAEKVTGVSLPMIASLVEKSLLMLEPSGRYGIHELLRQYGEEKLVASGELEAARQAHSSYYCHFMSQREADIKGRRQFAALNEIEADFENFRAAWYWELSKKQYHRLDSTLGSLFHFCEMRGRFQEGRELFGNAQEQLADEPAGDLRAIRERIRIRGIWMFKVMESAPDSAQAIKAEAEECLATARQRGDQAHIAFCLWLLGALCYVSKDSPRGIPFLEESLTLFTALSDRFYMAMAADWLGAVVASDGQLEAGNNLSQQSLDLRRAIGDRFGMAASLMNLGNGALEAGYYDKAKSYIQEMYQIYLEMGSGVWIARPAAALCWIAFQQGDFNETQARADERLEIFANHGASRVGGEGLVLAMLAMLAALEEDYARCWEMFKRAKLNTGVFNPVCEEGLAVAACGLEDYPAARHYFLEAVRLTSFFQDYRGMTIMLPVAAILLTQEGHHERAVEILGLAFHHHASAKIWMEQWPLLTRLRDALETKLGTGAYDDAWERGETLNLDETVAALLSQFLNDPDAQQQANQSLKEPLTMRELEVLNLIYAGLSNRHIAEQFVLAESTVKRHINHIYGKLAVETRSEALARARELGLLK